MSGLLVTGGGACGMALALAAKDMQAEIVSLPPRPQGRFYALSTAATEFLTTATGQTLPAAAQVRRFWLCAGGQRHVLPAQNDEPLCRIVDEKSLLEWLSAALHRRGIRVHTGEVAACRVSNDGVEVQTGDGQLITARMLAAVDGARSPTAKALGVGAAVSSFSQRAITGVFRVPDMDDETAGQWFARHDVLAFLPVGGGMFSLVWSLPAARASALSAQGAEATAEAARAHTGLSVEATGAIVDFPLSSVRRAVRIAQNTAFVGDSARVIHPLAGQGLNIALADAGLLIRCLQRRGMTTAALNDYAAGGRRRGAMWHVITAFFGVGGRAVSPLFAAAAMPPIARLAARAANMR